MSNVAWTDEENDLIVADYFAMLADGHLRAALQQGRAPAQADAPPSDPVRRVDRVQTPEHQCGAQGSWRGLDDGVTGQPSISRWRSSTQWARWLAVNPAWLSRMPGEHRAAGMQTAAQLLGGTTANAQ